MAYLSSDQRRQHILKAAIEVIAAEGLAAATTRRIADRAKAPLGAIHYCFKNKDELVRLIADEGAAMLKTYFDGFDPQKGIEATIRSDINSMWRWYQDNIGLQLALTEMGFARIRRGGPPKDVYAMWDRYGRTIMREHLAAAQKCDSRKLMVPIDEIVRFILHRFDGMTLEYAASKDKKSCQRQIELLTNAIIQMAVPATSKRSMQAAASPASPKSVNGKVLEAASAK